MSEFGFEKKMLSYRKFLFPTKFRAIYIYLNWLSKWRYYSGSALDEYGLCDSLYINGFNNLFTIIAKVLKQQLIVCWLLYAFICNYTKIMIILNIRPV